MGTTSRRWAIEGAVRTYFFISLLLLVALQLLLVIVKSYVFLGGLSTPLELCIFARQFLLLCVTDLRGIPAVCILAINRHSVTLHRMQKQSFVGTSKFARMQPGILRTLRFNVLSAPLFNDGSAES